MDSYQRPHQFNVSNQNSVEGRDSIESPNKNNQARYINQQNIQVSESQASLRFSQDTAGAKAKNIRYEGSPNKD